MAFAFVRVHVVVDYGLPGTRIILVLQYQDAQISKRGNTEAGEDPKKAFGEIFRITDVTTPLLARWSFRYGDFVVFAASWLSIHEKRS